MLTILVVSGCTRAPATLPEPHYALGAPYQVGGYWVYPRESYDMDETGLAVVAKDRRDSLTADGEAFDQTSLAAAHATLQLPAIARLTNLENGRQVTLRINDRGAANPHRLVEITRRTAYLLGIGDGAVTPVRLQVLPNESRAAADAVVGAPRLVMAVAPRAVVEVAELPPPTGSRQSEGAQIAQWRGPRPSNVPISGDALSSGAGAPPLRMPEVVTQTAAQPGRLMVRLDSFSARRYADIQQAKMAATGARVVTFHEGRSYHYRVEIGPLPDIARADAVLDLAVASGIPDARIVIE